MNVENVKGLKIVFFGGRLLGARCLNELIRRNENVQLVVPCPDDDGSQKLWYESVRGIAKNNNLAVSESSLTTDDEGLVAMIKKISPDVIFSIFYTKVLKEDVLSVPREGCINIHFAPLPRYRGYYPGTFAIINGESEHGVTMHYMSNKLDLGDIILQKKFAVEEGDTGESLYFKCVEAGFKVFKQGLDLLKAKKMPRISQKKEDSLYFKKQDLDKLNPFDLKKMDKNVYDLVRALVFPPFNPPSFYIGKEKMVIIKESEYKAIKDKKER